MKKPMKHIVFEKWFKAQFGSGLSSWEKREKLSGERTALRLQLEGITKELDQLERIEADYRAALYGWTAAKELAKKRVKAVR
jgi:hypothetical protein